MLHPHHVPDVFETVRDCIDKTVLDLLVNTTTAQHKMMAHDAFQCDTWGGVVPYTCGVTALLPGLFPGSPTVCSMNCTRIQGKIAW